MSSPTINLDHVKQQLADLLALVEQNGDIVIAQDGTPLARIVSMSPPKKRRTAGLNRGMIWTSDDFDAPLPDDFWLGNS